VPNGSFRILSCQYFQLDLVDSDGIAIERDTGGRSFHAVTAIVGRVTLVTDGQRLELTAFESALVPASTGVYRFEGIAPFQALVSLVP
jgi:mannose-6-phosphate isomerase class I